MGVEKLSVSFDLELGDAIKKSAVKNRGTVSGWLAEAARDRLRNEALGQALDSWELKFGKLDALEIAKAKEDLQGKTNPGMRKGA